MPKTGVIIGVRNQGTLWSMDVAEGFEKGKPKGKVTTITGDWRPMRDGLDSAFDISSDEFPYVSDQKIYENVIGQEIEYEPDPTFGASSWRPLGSKLFSLKMDLKTRKLKMLKEVV